MCQVHCCAVFENQLCYIYCLVDCNYILSVDLISLSQMKEPQEIRGLTYSKRMQSYYSVTYSVWHWQLASHIRQKNAELQFFHLSECDTGISCKLPSCHLFRIQWEQKGSLWTSWRSTIWSTRAPLVSWHVLSINAYVIYFFNFKSSRK